MKPATRIILFALLILIGAYSMGARVSWAFNFTVDSQEDLPDVNPGDTFCKAQNDKCTLRAAIQEANSFPIQHNIALPAGKYELSLGELIISQNISIVGVGQGTDPTQDTIIDGKNASRIFKVSDSTPLTLNNLRLQNGAHTADGTKTGGGGIYNQGTVMARNVTLDNNKGIDAGGNVNRGGGISNDGFLTLDYCTLSNNLAGNGGGLYNIGTAIIKNVPFDHNIAGSGSGVGGGIYNSGALTLEKDTIQYSSAGSGGGIFNDGIMDLTNVTLSGNSTTGNGGGIYNGSISTQGVVAQAKLINVTISDNTAPYPNGGGIFNKTGNIMEAKNTIIANNTDFNCDGIPINSNGFNLDHDYSCGLANPTDPIYTTDPSLGPLQFNEGPTFTQKLGNSSLKNIATECPLTDQRGYPRDTPFCDLGAYEDTTNNPFPAITTLAPYTSPEGGPAFTLTVNGYTYGTFLKGLSVVFWNGSPRTTYFETSSRLTADITAADLTTAGTAVVTVFNPGDGGGLSNEVAFTITRTNPFPIIASISPDSRPAGGPPFTLTVTGSNFVDQSSVVRWNGIARPTTFVDTSMLTADIPAADLTEMGTALVTVSNSPPGGGISDPPVPFTIGPPLLYLPIILRN